MPNVIWSVGFIMLMLLSRQPPAAAVPAAPVGHKRVLVLQLVPPNSDLARTIDDGYRRRLNAAFPEEVDYYSEYVDAYRFADPAYQESFRAFVRDRYSAVGLDVVIAANTVQLRMLRGSSDPLLPNVPIVFNAGIGERGDARSTGVVSQIDMAPVLDTALRLHPRTRHVVAIAGAGSFDSGYLDLARRQFQIFGSRVTFEYLVGRPVQEMERIVSQLPNDALVYFVLYSQSQSGEHFLPNEVLRRVARAATVPVYGVHEQMLGQGVVGGRLFSTEATVASTAELAIRILRGESPSNLPVKEFDPYVIAFDARQLSRWGIRRSDLPAGSVMRFQPSTAVERYGLSIALAAVVLCAVAVMIEIRRRRRAEAASREYLDAVATIDRRAVVNHFGESLAHELKQPLATIGTNVEAVRRLLDAGALDATTLREILDDIWTSNDRAEDIIDRIRSLVRHRPHEEVTIDLGALLEDTIRIVTPTAQAAGVRIDLELGDPRASVSGDPVHLQQVFTNLLSNAIDAVSGVESSRRRIVVESQVMPSTVDVIVRDRGAGFDNHLLLKVFEPSVTTKKDGMGMGLFIVQAIVDAHRGSVTAANDPNGGAVLRVRLPRRLHDLLSVAGRPMSA